MQALPVLSLWEWMTRYILRSASATAHCRTLRVAALCDLGLVSEALSITAGLMQGTDLPAATSHANLTHLNLEGIPIQPRTVPRFDAAKYPGDVANTGA